MSLSSTGYEERTDLSPVLDPDADSGSGGGDMDAWGYDRREQHDTLLTAQYTNESSYTLELGVTDGNAAYPYDEQVEMVPEMDAKTHDGATGDDMDAWGYDRREQHDTLLTAQYTNESSYTLHYGVTDGNAAHPYDEQGDIEQTVDEDTEEGYSERHMRAWSDRRLDAISTLTTATYQNHSQYDLPGSVVGTSGWETDVPGDEHAEIDNSVTVEGVFSDHLGNPMTGTAYLLEDENVLGETTSSGSFVISGIPPLGVLHGDEQDSTTVDFVFVPSVDGINHVEEGVTSGDETLIEVQYGRLTGSVRTYEGEPVPNETIQGMGAGAITDEGGEFEFLAPGDTLVPLVALDNTWEFEEYIEPGTTTEVQFRYPQLRIQVVDANYAPIEGTPVTVNGKTFYTDDRGYAEVDTPAIGLYEIVVQDYFEAEVAVDRPGERYDYTLGPDADMSPVDWGVDDGIGGVTITVTDDESGQPIKDVAAKDRETGAISASDEEGTLKILSTETDGTMDVEVGTGDRRYHTMMVQAELPEETMAEAEIQLRPRTQVVNY